MLRRIATLFIAALIIYIIYFDLTVGTLPIPVTNQVIATSTTIDETIIPYFEKKVATGETVLSVVEGSINGPLPVTITQMITDFRYLNDGLPPEKIKAGKTYRFPDYKI